MIALLLIAFPFSFSLSNDSVDDYKKGLQRSLKNEKLTVTNIIDEFVSFMENKFEFHDVKQLSEDIYLAAKNELQKY